MLLPALFAFLRLANLFLSPLFQALLVCAARLLFASLLFPTLLPFLTCLLLLLALLLPTLLAFLAGLLALLLAFLAGLLPLLLALLLALFALSLILLTTLLAATTSALRAGNTARAKQRRRDGEGRRRSIPKFSVHLKLPFNSAAERGMQDSDSATAIPVRKTATNATFCRTNGTI